MKISLWVLLALSAVLLCGCTSFDVVRSATFEDVYGEYLTVEYGLEEEAHVTYFVGMNGKKQTFKSKNKVRVTLPSGDDFIAFQNLSPEGLLYKTDDGQWEFLERGMRGWVAEKAKRGRGYELRFSGLRCASTELPRSRRQITEGSPVSATPQGFGRDSKGPPDSSGPRTVDDKK